MPKKAVSKPDWVCKEACAIKQGKAVMLALKEVAESKEACERRPMDDHQ